MTRAARIRPRRLLAVALMFGATACRHDSPMTRGIMALLDHPEEQTAGPRCRPQGQPYLRAGFRRPIRCFAEYADGIAFWRRDVWGVVQGAARIWRVPPGERGRWLRLRDSMTALVGQLAQAEPPCATRAAGDPGGELSAWYVRGYALAVRSAEPVPGGPRWHELRVEVSREDSLCRAAHKRLRPTPRMVGR